MTRSLQRLITAIIVAYAALFLSLGYWQVLAADSLTQDQEINGYRWYLQARADKRGSILDRNGQILAESVQTEQGFERRYPYPAAAPITGYWSLDHGTSGLERTYDAALRGQSGAGLDPILRRLIHEPVVGANVVTTIDLRLQRIADEALSGARGAAIVLDPRSGEVLALASHPHINPNKLEQDWPRLANAAGAPLFNRATSGLYPPGSTFKTITFAAALETGVVRPDTMFEDPDNGIVVDRYRINDPNHPGVPRFDAMHALALSSNSAFAEIGVELNGDRLREQARRFGFEQEIPFDLPTEQSRLSDDLNFLRSDLGVATTAIGQGRLQATPLQMALVAAGFANQGNIMRPRLVTEVRSAEGGSVARLSPVPLYNATSPEIARTVGEAMALAVRETPVQSVALPNVQVAAKSGTAEVSQGVQTHAWMIAFAPLEAPRIAVVVIHENAGGGSTVAGPVVRRLLETGLQILPP